MTLITAEGAGTEGRTEPGQEGIAQKNAALWIYYSYLSVSRRSGPDVLDNGGCFFLPVQKGKKTEKTPEAFNYGMTDDELFRNEGKIW